MPLKSQGTTQRDFPHIGGVGGTCGGNPLVYAAALESIEVVKDSLDNAIKVGEINYEQM
ncbi:hypothetical protein Asulf_00587 [Archaeoglobus sulfaticallidus PM70-1]|uniref:Uncharacterized protein n=1 Tax=Archaeoglobus sulfaticallidus PM70-1 TaxID=387631 RepID=N0BED4_9EURY|nr:hypothetical protein [Archaeoglobus sulfaticallidus]AGK60607.1 hypothetical protein Asulf_00587 [Archaeoglobus sulfaticallidus PM70-1]